MVVVVVIIVMTPRTDTIEISDEEWVSSSADGISEQFPQPVDQPSEISTPEELTEGLIQHTEQVQAPADAVSDPDIYLANNQSVTDSTTALGNELASDNPEQEVTVSGSVSGLEVLPVPAAVKERTSVLDGENTDTSSDTESRALVAMKEPAAAATETLAQATVRADGPWVINLASVQHKKNADHFRAKVESRGIAAELYQVTVKGRDYWRVHVPGFATAAEARAEARLIKEKLGIDDVWIAKQ